MEVNARPLPYLLDSPLEYIDLMTIRNIEDELRLPRLFQDNIPSWFVEWNCPPLSALPHDLKGVAFYTLPC